MNTAEKENIRKIILEKINTLKKSIETFKKLSKPVSPDNAIGRITRMEAINSKGINEAAFIKSRQHLKALETSIEMIEDPDFGCCRRCEEPIPYKRLLLVPEAPFCVPCAAKVTER